MPTGSSSLFGVECVQVCGGILLGALFVPFQAIEFHCGFALSTIHTTLKFRLVVALLE